MTLPHGPKPDLAALDALIEAVQAGHYERPNGVQRYHDFGTDSEGVIRLGKADRMALLLDGTTTAVERLRSYRATCEGPHLTGATNAPQEPNDQQ